MKNTGRKIEVKNIIGYVLILIGLMMLAFSKAIVFPGLERMVGIEKLVGKENVIYQPDGSYSFTNPRAQMEWIVSVATLGLLTGALGFWLSAIRLKFPAAKDKKLN